MLFLISSSKVICQLLVHSHHQETWLLIIPKVRSYIFSFFHTSHMKKLEYAHIRKLHEAILSRPLRQCARIICVGVWVRWESIWVCVCVCVWLNEAHTLSYILSTDTPIQVSQADNPAGVEKNEDKSQSSKLYFSLNKNWNTVMIIHVKKFFPLTW